MSLKSKSCKPNKKCIISSVNSPINHAAGAAAAAACQCGDKFVKQRWSESKFVMLWFASFHCHSVCLIVAVVAELLLKEFVEFKQNKYYIRAVQDSDVATVTECENASSHDENHGSSIDPLVIKVTNIPHGMSEQTFQMILENKRYGGGEIRRMEFRESESEHSAVVEFEERAGMYSQQFVFSGLIVLSLSSSSLSS